MKNYLLMNLLDTVLSFCFHLFFLHVAWANYGVNNFTVGQAELINERKDRIWDQSRALDVSLIILINIGYSISSVSVPVWLFVFWMHLVKASWVLTVLQLFACANFLSCFFCIYLVL